ncbi:MAG TPA: NADH-quinone oxidoreductase subunit J [Candidatus Limnocylindria bacterium]|nr:NADH-quinone oxidoreductase subunit J [Candidatus Limnocylindria bacterium]
MTLVEILFAVLASLCVGAALFSVTRRDARSAIIGLTVVLMGTAALLAMLGATIAAVAQVVVYALGTVPFIAALTRMPLLRDGRARRGRPRLALAAALLGVAFTTVMGVAILRSVMPETPPPREAPALLDAAAAEIVGRRSLAFAALVMAVVAALIVSGAARRNAAERR